MYKTDVVRSVQRHPLDFNSLEVSIAVLTVAIRNVQGISEAMSGSEQRKGSPRWNKCLMHRIKHMIDHRRALMRYLRQRDHKKFEWLLEKLDLYFRERPNTWERVERKGHMRRLVDLWCEEHKQFKLDTVRESLEQEQPKYLREKAENLK